MLVQLLATELGPKTGGALACIRRRRHASVDPSPSSCPPPLSSSTCTSFRYAPRCSPVVAFQRGPRPPNATSAAAPCWPSPSSGGSGEREWPWRGVGGVPSSGGTSQRSRGRSASLTTSFSTAGQSVGPAPTSHGRSAHPPKTYRWSAAAHAACPCRGSGGSPEGVSSTQLALRGSKACSSRSVRRRCTRMREAVCTAASTPPRPRRTGRGASGSSEAKRSSSGASWLLLIQMEEPLVGDMLHSSCRGGPTRLRKVSKALRLRYWSAA